ncbi:hypothetical protein [Rothia sp. ZJ932]|uniref:hypothetical protein n=1 Tax=Rothia sp. ZJ932 TaxID=2810516 RepID=UPI0019684B39|nr:hypothetical protein [Rothia sp. ZJ932]QRZ61798.1 hypothetical protein JR346_01250 [Rothia sp. ZJ932]
MTTYSDFENMDMSNLTLADHEKIGKALSAWAESDDFFEALDRTEFLPRTPEGVEQAEKIVRAATRGRPALSTAVHGKSPTVNARVTPNIKERLTSYAKDQGLKPSDVIRDALDSYLPKTA